MSLRLLPAFTMDNDEDDDGNFTKWMSSYWGHGAEARQRERKRSFRRPKRTQADRRPSLPTVVRSPLFPYYPPLELGKSSV
uniref:Leukemia NUP98 fusion partner 1 n=1 Tax=Gouania willdenowi TaxID=441366 RepID=A0A8C5EEP1_GOUWI